MGSIGQEPSQVEVAKVALPDNHTIEQLNVKFVDGVEGEYGSYLIDVGNGKGTLSCNFISVQK